MITKEEAIKYFEEHREDIFELCERFDLRFPYENRVELMQYYNHLKSVLERCESRKGRQTPQYKTISDELVRLEKTYHLFNPDFNERSEERWIPKNYGQDAYNVFEFRKDAFSTQSIWHDHELNGIISQDIWSLWEEKGGQDGMYEAFPFTVTKESVVRESDSYSDYLKTDVHSTVKLIRSYYLSGSGGLAIIEEREYSHFSDMTHVRPDAQDSYRSSFKVVTLGEDDANLFLMGRYLYEDIQCSGKDEFLNALNLLIKEYENYN